MFSLYPSPIHHVHQPAYYYNDDRDFLSRDYFHALAQQQQQRATRERQRAQLEQAARRRREYYDRAFMSGFGVDDESVIRPYRFVSPESVLGEAACVRQTGRGEKGQDEECFDVPKSVQVVPDANEEVKQTLPSESTPHPPDPDLGIREAAARTIQSFLRTQLRRVSALRAIEDILRRFEDLKSRFTLPAALDFGDCGDGDHSDGSVPKLLYTPRNVPVHAYEETLVALLVELDAVESGGDGRVREMRRGIVGKIEGELGRVEEGKGEVWRGMVSG